MFISPPAEYLIAQAEAESVLAPFVQVVASAMDKVFGEWRSHVLPLVPQFRGHTQSSFIQDALERELRTRLGGHPDVEFSVLGAERFWLKIKTATLDKVLLRFKKLDDHFATRNVRTKTANFFDLQLRLEGIPDLPRITAGYRLSADNSEIKSLWIALLKGKRALWKYELIADAAGVYSIVAPSTPDLFDALKLKPNAKKKRKAENK